MYIEIKLLILIVILKIETCCAFNFKPKSPEHTIANVVKKFIFDKNSYTVTQMMKKHYVHMKLLKTTTGLPFHEKDVWLHPKLATIGSFLLPRNLTGKDLSDLVDQMAENAIKNKYLHDFLLQSEISYFTEILSKVEMEGGAIFPDVIAYAMVLEKLTLAMRNVWKILEACNQVWREYYKPHNTLKEFILPSIEKLNIDPWMGPVLIKSLSVQWIVEDTLKLFQRNKRIPKNFGDHHLFINIKEAVFYDITQGNWNNAEAGKILAKVIGNRKSSDCNGSGPSKLSADGQAIEYAPAYPMQWADLYTTWNLAFVTNSKSWPYAFTKLLIPSVSGYHLDNSRNSGKPQEFMHNRVMALYAHINWATMYYSNGVIDVNLDWYSRKLSTLWGMANKKYAKDYESLLGMC